MTTSDLKHLKFVEQQSKIATDVSAGLYYTARQYVPSFAEPYVSQAEQQVASVGAPYVNKAQDASLRTLKAADVQVDKLGVMYRDNFQKAQELYFSRLNDAVKFVQEQGLSGTMNAAVERLQSAIADAKKAPAWLTDRTADALTGVYNAWENFKKQPAVKGYLDKVTPAVDAAQKQLNMLRDAVVGHPYYKYVWDMSWSTVDNVKGMGVYKQASSMLYPWLQPIAEPPLEKIQSTELYKQFLQQITPPRSTPAVPPTPVSTMSYAEAAAS